MIKTDKSLFTLNQCDTMLDFEHDAKFRKVPLSELQQSKINQLLGYLPQAGAASQLKNAWVAHFPPGFSKADMMKYQNGGRGNTLMGERGIETYAPLTSLDTAGIVLDIFNVLSAATGQYFLSRIDNQLQLVNTKLDDILNFLYGENRAELLAELHFVKRAHENYSSIMLSETQRIATVNSLQASQKIAVKDLEFYLSDLENIVHRNTTDFRSVCKVEEDAWRSLKCIELALQTCVISSLLEIHFSENYDPAYIEYVKNEMIAYINHCNHAVLMSLTAVDEKLRTYHAAPFENVEARQKYRTYVKNLMAPYKSEQDLPIRKTLEEALKALHMEKTYYLTSDGSVYYKESR